MLELARTPQIAKRLPGYFNDIHVNSEPSSRVKTVLLIDGDDRARLSTKWFLSSFHFGVDSARNAEEALLLFDPKVHDAIITENRLPGISGSELAHIIKLRARGTPIVMYGSPPVKDSSCFHTVILKPTPLLILKGVLDALFGLAPHSGTPSLPNDGAVILPWLRQ